MRAILILLTMLMLNACSTVRHFGNWDILCSGGFNPIQLKEDFRSPQGIVLPKGTVAYMRECQYGNQVYLPAVIEPAFVRSYEAVVVPTKEKPHYPLIPISGGG